MSVVNELNLVKREAAITSNQINRNTALKPLHEKRLATLNRIIDFLEGNVNQLHNCSHCGCIMYVNNCKIYCSEKCKVSTFRKNKKETLNTKTK